MAMAAAIPKPDCPMRATLTAFGSFCATGMLAMPPPVFPSQLVLHGTSMLVFLPPLSFRAVYDNPGRGHAWMRLAAAAGSLPDW